MRALLFADLEKAYDMIVREMAVGNRKCTDSVDLAIFSYNALVLHGDDIQWPAFRSNVRSVERQGCGRHFGDIIFSMLYAKATREVASCVRSENLSCTLLFDTLRCAVAMLCSLP